MSKTRAYVSHSIRGKYGKDATKKQMEENNNKAMEFAKLLRKQFTTIDFYIPAEHDEFVLEAYTHKRITENEILETDCNIIAKCNFMIVYSPDNYISHGMQYEVHFATDNNIPLFYIYSETPTAQTVKEINFFLEKLMKS